MHVDTQDLVFEVDSPYVDLAVEVFTLLADTTRVRIILALQQQEMSVNHLAQTVGKGPTAVSQHLAKLRWGRIVKARPDGNRAIYSLVDEHARQLVIQAVLQAQHAVEDLPSHHAQPPASPPAP
ncbi:MAG: ArsR/SmtB family transcription factor [Beutenbergiaceae bacterium]